MNIAAFRSAVLRNKVVMRLGCCLVVVSMLMSCYAAPRAKAVFSETALIGSIFGSLLVSMGFSWAAENFDAPTFGETMYDLIQEFDETNTDTGIQLIRDLNLASLTVTKPGTIQFNYAWTQAARSFAEWFQGKFFSSGNSSSVVLPGMDKVTFLDGTTVTLGSVVPNSVYFKSAIVGGGSIPVIESSERVCFYLTDEYFLSYRNYKDSGKWNFPLYSASSDGGNEIGFQQSTTTYQVNPYEQALHFGADSNYLYFGHTVNLTSGLEWNVMRIPLSDVTLSHTSALSAEKPQEINYPDVAEESNQVYEVAYQGVTATDIEGIIQRAVDDILAGTAEIAGSVAAAEEVPATPEEPPELDGLDLPALGAALTSRFPFSIPWDVARGIKLLAAPSEAPFWEVDFLAPIGYRVGGWKGDTTVVIDMSEYEIIGQVSRWMSTIGFCLMLAASTKRLVWVA